MKNQVRGKRPPACNSDFTVFEPVLWTIVLLSNIIGSGCVWVETISMSGDSNFRIIFGGQTNKYCVSLSLIVTLKLPKAVMFAFCFFVGQSFFFGGGGVGSALGSVGFI